MLAALICLCARASSAESPGFPIDLQAVPVGSPRVLDLDGDEDDDVIAATRDGRVFVFSKQGASFPGAPVDLSQLLGQAVTLSAPPAFGDLDESGTFRMVLVTDDGTLAVLRADLSLELAQSLGADALTTPVVAQSREGARLIVLSVDGALHVLDATGAKTNGSPLQLPSGTWAPAVAVADVDRDGVLDVALARVGDDGHAYATRVTLGTSPEVAAGWPVDLGPATRVLPPVVADFDGDGQSELVFGAEGQLPVVLRASGDPAIALADVPVGNAPAVLMAAADLDGDGTAELLCAVDDGLAAFAVGTQLRRNRQLTPLPAPMRDGFPIDAAQVAQSGPAVADVAGDSDRDLIVSTGDAVTVRSRFGAEALGWPQPAGAPLAGAVAVGAQRDVMVIAAVSEDGVLHLWDGVGQPQHVAWDGFQHDPGNTGALSTPLPPRTVHPISGGGGAPPKEQGCCQGSIGGFELSALSALLVLGRLRLRGRLRRR